MESSAAGRVVDTLGMVSSEPICFLLHFAGAMMNTVLPKAMQTKIEESYMDDTTTMNGFDRSRYIQTKVVEWNMLMMLPAIPVTTVFAAFLGAYSDKYGRQVTMLLGAFGQSMLFFCMVVVFSTWLSAPLWLLPSAFITSSVSGGIPVILMSCQAFVTDTEPDKQHVPVRVAWVSGSKWAGLLLGTISTQFLYPLLGTTYWLFAAQSLCLLCFAWAWFRIPHVPPGRMRHALCEAAGGGGTATEGADDGDAQSTEMNGSPQPVQQRSAAQSDPPTGGPPMMTGGDPDEPLGVMWFLRLCKAAVMTVVRRREGNRRCAILLMMFVFAIVALSIMEGQIFVGIYTLDEPLKWGPGELGIWSATGMFLDLVGTTAGTYVLKRLLHISDFDLLTVGLVSVMLQMLPIGLVRQDWYMYVAVVLGTLDGVTMPALVSIGNRLVGVEELGRFMTAGNLLSNLSVTAFQTAVLQPVYLATLREAWPWRGTVFYVCAALAAIAAVDAQLVKRLVKRQGRVRPKPPPSLTVSDGGDGARPQSAAGHMVEESLLYSERVETMAPYYGSLSAHYHEYADQK